MQYLIITLLFSLLAHAQGFINWQPPHAHTKPTGKNGHSGMSMKKEKQFQLNNFDPTAKSTVSYIMPTLEKRDLNITNSIVTLPRTGMDNYHALIVNQIHEDNIRSSVRYIYSHGRPSKTSPTKITQMNKSELEIIPSPLPREHNHYKSSDSYQFELRFKGKALPENRVSLITSNGTEETFRTDKKGKFHITLLNDFQDVKPGKRANKPAEFVLKASHPHANIMYTTSLAMPYYVNPLDYWQSQITGLVVLIIGLAIGLFLFRNIHKKKKRQA